MPLACAAPFWFWYHPDWVEVCTVSNHASVNQRLPLKPAPSPLRPMNVCCVVVTVSDAPPAWSWSSCLVVAPTSPDDEDDDEDDGEGGELSGKWL